MGLAAGFSTSFWKIYGWLERQAFFRRTVGLGVFMNGILPAPLTWPGAIRTIRARRGVAPNVPAVISSSDAPVPRQPTGL